MDLVIVEIGGTVGDIESLPFIEAIRQMRQELGRENTLFVHVTLVPYIAAAGELKTKPTQHSVKELLSVGIQPDILLCRADRYLSHDTQVEDCAVLQRRRRGGGYRAKTWHRFTKFRWCSRMKRLTSWRCVICGMQAPEPNLAKWEDLVHRIYNPKDEVTIGIVGKYVEYEDSYKSLKEALVHGAVAHNLKLSVDWIEAEGLESKDQTVQAQLEAVDGILVPGGFGKRGIEGMLKGIQYARENKVPYFGICLGMQTACIEFARNVCGLEQANSSEFDPATPHRVIYKLRELRGVEELGGTMRLGAWACRLEHGSLAQQAYGQTEISERHRHRYEFNREYESTLTAGGLRIAGRPRTGPTSRSSRFPVIHSSWDASSIRNSSPSRSSRILCSRHSSGPAMRTACRTSKDEGSGGGTVSAARKTETVIRSNSADRDVQFELFTTKARLLFAA